MDDRTFTADEIVTATMDHHRGCIEGKHEFLRDAFGIEPNEDWAGDYTVTCTVYVRVKPNRIQPSEMHDGDGLALSVEDFLAAQFRAENLSDSATGIDFIDDWDITVCKERNEDGTIPAPDVVETVPVFNELGQRQVMQLDPVEPFTAVAYYPAGVDLDASADHKAFDE